MGRCEIKSLGQGCWSSPVVGVAGCNTVGIGEEERILMDDRIILPAEGFSGSGDGFELAGPRASLFFNPAVTRAAIVTCGGLCPGLNDVIRALVLSLWHTYGVREIVGFQNGYQGMMREYGHEVIALNPEVVDGWQDLGGTKLGSSRGEQNASDMVDTLERLGINLFFPIGGDGTMRGAQAIAEGIERRDLSIAVVGIPKTIDNDILAIDESFGFQSAYGAAVDILRCAHVEAKGAPNGIGMVKLMGRHSGFIACHAALAMSVVNFVLIPEVPFVLEGEGGLLRGLEERLRERRHAVIVVAEGAGQNLIAGENGRDRSGNLVFKDIGLFLKSQIEGHFAARKMECNVRYIDPSYAIRGVPANAYDSVYCLQLGHDAVHAAMAGKTEMLVGKWHGRIVHIPMPMVTQGRKRVEPESSLWQMVLASTGQRKWITL